MISGFLPFVALVLLARLPKIVEYARDWRVAAAAPPGEIENLELAARMHAGRLELAWRLVGPPSLDGANVIAKLGERRAWAEIHGWGPFELLAEVEVDPALQLLIRRPTFYKRKRGSARVSSPSELEQPDVRFDVQTAKDARGAIQEELFSHAGSQLTDALAELLYVHGADEVRASEGRLSVRVETRNLVGERLFLVLGALDAVARAYARRAVPVAIGALVERYLWLEGNAPRCPYCHVDIAEGETGLAACGKCRTLHHEACFREHGGCTLLGCGGRERASG